MDVRAPQPPATNPANSQPPSAPAAPTTPQQQGPTGIPFLDGILNIFKGIGDAIAKAFTNGGQDTLQRGPTPGERGAELNRVPPPASTRNALQPPA